MSISDHTDYTRAAAICVNFALDSVEADILREIDSGSDAPSETLLRLLARLRKRRIDVDALATVSGLQ